MSASKSSKDYLLPFRPAPCRRDYLDNDLFVAANFATAFAASAGLLTSKLHWDATTEASKLESAAFMAETAAFLSRMVGKCQDALGAVSYQLTAIRMSGPYCIGAFSEENAHRVAYRIGIATVLRLTHNLPLSVWRCDDVSRLAGQIVRNWRSCQAAMTAPHLPSIREVEAQVAWEATQVQAVRSEELQADQIATPHDIPLHDQIRLSVANAAQVVGVSDRTIREWRHNGKLVVKEHESGHLVFSKSALEILRHAYKEAPEKRS